jgi:hypothetical protein
MKNPEFRDHLEMQAFLDKEKAKGAIIVQPSDLTPVSYFRPVLEVVTLAPQHVYYAQKYYRLTYAGLMEIGRAAGVEWDPLNSCRIDDGTDKFYVSYRAVGGVKKNDGRLYPMQNTYDLELDIIKEEIEESYFNDKKRNNKYNKKKTDEEYRIYAEDCISRDFRAKRRRKLTLAESGAKARVLRFILGLKNQFRAAELNIEADKYGNALSVGMPFLVIRFVMDYENPEIKKILLDSLAQNMTGLYGAVPTQQALPLRSRVSEIIDVPVDHDHEPEIEPEPEAEPEPEPEQAPTPMKPAGADEPNEAPTEREQFLLYDAQTQGSILDQLSKKVGYDIKHFCEQAKVMGPDQLSEAKRVEFYDFLTKENVAA